MRHIMILAALTLAACGGPSVRNSSSSGTMSGLDVLVADEFRALKGKRIGVLTNSTAVDRRGRSIVDMLAQASGVNLAAIFTPEHGYAAAPRLDQILGGGPTGGRDENDLGQGGGIPKCDRGRRTTHRQPKCQERSHSPSLLSNPGKRNSSLG